MALKLITPPAAEPISLTEAKTHLKVDGADEDTLINGLIKNAREYCEGFQNRVYITQTWELTLDEWPDTPLDVPKSPLQSVVSIKYTDKDGVETTWDTANYIVDTDSEPGRIALAYNKSLPAATLKPINAIKIRFTCGYGDATTVPQAVKQAMLLHIGHFYEHRGDDKAEVPAAVDNLLWPERIVPV